MLHAEAALEQLLGTINQQQNAHPGVFIIAGDFNKTNLRSFLIRLFEQVPCPTTWSHVHKPGQCKDSRLLCPQFHSVTDPDFQDSQDRYENVINNKSKKSVETSWTNKQCSVWKELIIVTLVWLHVELSRTQAQDNASWQFTTRIGKSCHCLCSSLAPFNPLCASCLVPLQHHCCCIKDPLPIQLVKACLPSASHHHWNCPYILQNCCHYPSFGRKTHSSVITETALDKIHQWAAWGSWLRTLPQPHPPQPKCSLLHRLWPYPPQQKSPTLCWTGPHLTSQSIQLKPILGQSPGAHLS